MYEHTLRIPLVVMGPGIPSGGVLSHLGTNVDLAPTWLELAGVEPPPCMDGRSILQLLLPDVRLHAALMPATSRLLAARRAAPGYNALVASDPHAWRNESFFQYYDAGPWAPANGGDDCPICTAGKGTVRKFDDYSNTYIGLYVHDPALGKYKYVYTLVLLYCLGQVHETIIWIAQYY